MDLGIRVPAVLLGAVLLRGEKGAHSFGDDAVSDSVRRFRAGFKID